MIAELSDKETNVFSNQCVQFIRIQEWLLISYVNSLFILKDNKQPMLEDITSLNEISSIFKKKNTTAKTLSIFFHQHYWEHANRYL